MTEIPNISPADKDGKYEFSIYYSEREVPCRVEKEQNQLHVYLNNNMAAELEIQSDGSITQTSGEELPASTIDYIKKHVLGHNV